ncbi:LamG-like jellyroll fold domain-containing protein [Pseudomonas sp.]|uniref:LamG-like jellyroll fold domain-containing protein n=1 Tax=Pseudomonas sp. TaxID=306 RepID=UPI002915803B|nr:LamG-like jellyroll fold domain-containing protein [Pseudomonas sp.]MDU4248995.1 LamG-like jellyroll fold domain-containing protein [Pseudomonas sp.]
MIINPYVFAASGPPTDPLWAYVVSLLQFEGTEGSATFTDESTIAATATQYGSPVITSAAGKFGRGFSGNGGSSGRALLLPSNAAYGIGTGDFCMEAFIRNDNGSQDVGILGIGESGSILMLSTTATDLRVRRAGYPDFGTLITLSTGTLPVGVYRHVEIDRASGVIYLFVDGVLRFSGAFTDSISAAPISIGAWQPSSGSDRIAFNGAIDGWRLTVGAARHTTDFSPPSGPFPTS